VWREGILARTERLTRCALTSPPDVPIRRAKAKWPRSTGGCMSAPQLLVHDKKDTVGVVVIEGLTAGTDMLCVVTADDSSFRLRSRMDVPIGHKVALTDIKAGDTVWKYGQDIGKAVANIAKGDHVHVHNLKTKRW
jgi:(2R)-sulfolactate sulfo-lyase subunit alpha